MIVPPEYVIEIKADLVELKGVLLWLLWLRFGLMFTLFVVCNSAEI